MKPVVLFLLLIPLQLWSQPRNQLPQLPLALAYSPHELPAILADGDQNRIKNNLIRLCGEQHLIASQGEQSFGILPRIDIVEEYDGEGMNNLRFVKIDFGISVKETASGINLGAYQWTLTGSGKNQQQAIMAALRKIPREDAGFDRFLAELRPKLNQYYLANCDAIIKKADRLIVIGEYEKAIAELMKIPTEATDCSQLADQKLQSAYDEFQRIHCGPILQEARAASAKREFSKALDLLLLISPTSSCAEEANAVINQIGQTKNQLHQQKYTFAKEMHQQQFDAAIASHNLSMQRWIGITEIAKTVGGIADIFNPSINFNLKLNP